MPAYGYGNIRTGVYRYGAKIGNVYRYGAHVYQSRVPEWGQATLNNMSTVRAHAAAAAIPGANVVLVAGGKDTPYLNSPYNPTATVDLYNEAGVRTLANNLRYAKFILAGAGIGSKAIFAGGYRASATDGYADMYNSSGVRTTLTALGIAGPHVACAVAGSYIIFAGSLNTVNGTTSYQTAVAYDEAGTKTTITSLSYTRGDISTAQSGGFAFMCWGRIGSIRYNRFDIYNSSLVRTYYSTLSAATNKPVGTACGDGVLFLTGSTAIHITTAGVLSSTTAATVAEGFAAGTLSGLSVFTGKYPGQGVSQLEVYDSSKVKMTPAFTLSTNRLWSSFATLNNTLYLFGGSTALDGNDYPLVSNTAETIFYK